MPSQLSTMQLNVEHVFQFNTSEWMEVMWYNLSSKVSPVIQSHCRVQWSSSQSSPAITHNSLQFFLYWLLYLNCKKIHLLSRKKNPLELGSQTWDLPSISWTFLPLSHWIYSEGAEAILLITAMLEALAVFPSLTIGYTTLVMNGALL